MKGVAARRSRIIALKVAAALLLGGMAWILVTDVLLYEVVHDRVQIARIETAKGWLFVGFFVLVGFKLTGRLTHELALSEATNKALFDSTADGVLLLGTDGTIESANASAAHILGVERPEELVGLGAQDFARRFHLSLPDGRIVDPADYTSQRALDGEVSPPYKALLHPPGGAEVVILSTAAPVRAAPGCPVEAAVSVMCDITELESLEQTRDRFFASAAHALKTPVTIIKAQVHLLRTSLAPKESALAAIERQCGKIDHLTDNLLTMLRIRTHTLRLHPEEVDLVTLLDEATEEMEREMVGTAAEHGLLVRRRARPRVFGDRERLAQALRVQTDLVLRSRRPNTDVTLVVDENAGNATVSFTYEPLDLEAPQTLEAGCGGLGVGAHLVEPLIEMTGGTVRTEVVDGTRRVDTLELPAVSRPSDAEL